MSAIALCIDVVMRLKVLSSLALGLLLSACASGLEYEQHFPVAASYAIHGVDVSKYQGDIDWNAARDDGVKFAYIKATEGGDVVDDKFQQNWENARAAGIKRGAYHFVYWCRTPEEQIRWFTQNVPADADALPPVLDVELTPTSKTCPASFLSDAAAAGTAEAAAGVLPAAALFDMTLKRSQPNNKQAGK